MLGGKGANQAVGLAQLGMSVSLVGAVGGGAR
jgi:sugar/nucleoside kinase (ribokinase family)